ncbi:MAG TPA: universal stress protein [Acetobacteraceae bacterium]|nr:universal stress protein [Acetobacteraceae bacterium]
MAIRKILVPVVGRLDHTDALDLAVDLARILRAHVEALYLKLDREQVLVTGYEDKNIGWIDRNYDSLPQLIDEAGEAAFATFQAWTKHRHVAISPQRPVRANEVSVSWRERIGLPESVIADSARFCDLVAVPRPDGVDPSRRWPMIYAALVLAAHPVILLPPRSTTRSWETAIVAWDGSPQAQHALTAAMPVLARMHRVILLTIGAVDGAGPAQDEELLGYLSYHEVRAERLILERDRRGVGVRILEEAKANAAELLVMGAYTHSPTYEAIFGGPTLHVIETTDLPVLMVH